MIKIAVVIPSAGRETETTRLLADIKSQPVKPDEVILVECIKDTKFFSAKSLSKNFLGTKIKTKYLTTTKKIIAHSRNIGIRNCDADWLLFLDNDVSVEKDFVKKLVSIVKKERDLFAVVGRVKALRKGYLADYSAHVFCRGLSGTKKVKNLDFYATLAAALNLKKVKQWKMSFDEKLATGEDTDFFLRAYKKGGVIRYHPEFVAYHEFETNDWKRFAKRFFAYGRNFLDVEERHPKEFIAPGYFPATLGQWVFWPWLLTAYIWRVVVDLKKVKYLPAGHWAAAFVSYLAMTMGVYTSDKGRERLRQGWKKII